MCMVHLKSLKVIQCATSFSYIHLYISVFYVSVSSASNLSFRIKNVLQRRKCVVVKTNRGVNNECAMNNYSKVFKKGSNSHVHNELHKSLIKL